MEEEFRSIKGNGFGWVMSWIRIVENETLDERDVCDLIGAEKSRERKREGNAGREKRWVFGQRLRF